MTEPATDERAQLERRIAELERELSDLTAQHRIEREHDRLRHQDHALGLIAEAEAARVKNSLLTKRINRLKERVDATARIERRQRELSDELAAIHASRSWRLARVVRLPGRGRRS